MSETAQLFTAHIKAPDGIIAADSFFVRQWDEDFDARLSYAVDYTGVTDQVADFPDRDWSDVYAEVTAEVARRCREGELFLAVLERKAQYIIRVDSPSTGPHALPSVNRYRRFIRIVEGPLLIAESCELEGYGSWRKEPSIPVTMPLTPGNYVVELSLLSRPSGTQPNPGEFWGPGIPGLALAISSAATMSEAEAGRGGFFVIDQGMFSPFRGA